MGRWRVRRRVVTKLLAGCRTVPVEVFRFFGGEGPGLGRVLNENPSSGKLNSEHFHDFLGAHSNTNRTIDCRIRAELEIGFRSLRKELRIAPVPVRCASGFQASSLFAHHGRTVSPLSALPTAREITLPCPPHISARDCQHFTSSLESNHLSNYPFLQSPSKPSHNSSHTNRTV